MLKIYMVGSVLLFGNLDDYTHSICLQLAAIYSSYWKLPSNLPVRINYTECKNVVKSAKMAKGSFMLTSLKSDTIIVKLPVYYDSNKGILTYCRSDQLVGYLIKSNTPLESAIRRVLKNRANRMSSQLISLWFPIFGQIDETKQ